MEVLGQFESRTQARAAREKMARELGARLDFGEDVYRYERDGQQRLLRVVQGGKNNWQVVLE